MNFFKKKKIRVTLWSLNDEGKTNLLYKGFLGIKDCKSIPTCGFNVEAIDSNEIKITFWDIGYGSKTKDLRNNYLPSNDAIIFLIDSSKSVLPTDEYSFLKIFMKNYKNVLILLKIYHF